MKIRTGFVSNSSSTSFIICNNTDKPLTLVDFVKENPQLVEEFNTEYSGNYTQDDMISCAVGQREEEIFKVGDNYVTYGDEEGDAIGTVFDYILRHGGESKRFSWRFVEFQR